MQLTNLKETFENYPLDSLNDYKDYISSKDDDGVFPPYIPFVGKHYEKYRILFYATAQNIPFEDPLCVTYAKNRKKLTERLWHGKKFKNKYPKDNFSYHDIAIQPVQDGIIPAYLGIFLYTIFNLNISTIENLNDIIDKVAISNYYKFSLRKGKKDIHPDKLKENNIKPSQYFSLNDELVKLEIKDLDPTYIITFNNPGYNNLIDLLGEKYVHTITDPASLKNYDGGWNFDKTNLNNWYNMYDANKINDSRISKLLNIYKKQIDGKGYNTEHRKHQLVTIMRKNYLDWSQEKELL